MSAEAPGAPTQAASTGDLSTSSPSTQIVKETSPGLSASSLLRDAAALERILGDSPFPSLSEKKEDFPPDSGSPFTTEEESRDSSGISRQQVKPDPSSSESEAPASRSMKQQRIQPMIEELFGSGSALDTDRNHELTTHEFQRIHRVLFPLHCLPCVARLFSPFTDVKVRYFKHGGLHCPE